MAEKKQSGGKAKKKAAQEVLITRAVRNKKKCVTTVAGLEHFGVKLGEAAKVFGKKFASGASVTKTATGGEEIDIQVRRCLSEFVASITADIRVTCWMLARQ